MKYTFLSRYILLFTFLLSLSSCEKTENQIPADVEIQDFVWKGMNAFYLWQEQVPDLSDRRFSSQPELNNFLTNFSNPVDIFQHLRFQPGVVDRFSVIVDDYIALENSFQGINQSNGMEFGVVQFADNSDNVFGYVRYVIPGSDADTQGVTRGMLFTRVDGVELTFDNFRGLLFSNVGSYTITLANYNSGNPVANGTDITLTRSQIQENPIAVTATFNEGANRIGYLMYNQFASSFDQQLNATFATFQSQGITDLIIDLRYNGGGSVSTATFLGGMVTGQFNGQLFSREFWNSKVRANVNESTFINNFTNQLVSGTVNEPINSLNLTRVYFITTRSTASASELIINSLSSYIDTFTVGTTTIGKVHGSVTLYDSDSFTRNGDNLNPNHTWAIQPLTFEIQNRDGTNAPGGIIPTVELQEDYGNLGVLGQRTDPLLDRTINLIVNGSRSPIQSHNPIRLQEVSGSKNHTLSGTRMYKELK